MPPLAGLILTRQEVGTAGALSSVGRMSEDHRARRDETPEERADRNWLERHYHLVYHYSRKP